MREHKFRYWLQYLDNHKEAHFFTIENIENHRGLNRKALFEAGIKILARDEYTGKKDKNNRDIYDNYCLKWKDNIFRVKWDKFNGCWYGKPHISNKDRGILVALTFENSEIIGNKFENSELLNY